jgi:two-component system sensor histidine kinase YesM
MKKIHLSFRGRVFLACLAVALVPLFLSSIVMVRLFTASLNRQSEQEAQRQISEISSRFTALLEDCENVCREQTKDGSVARYMIDTTTVEMQRGCIRHPRKYTDMRRSAFTMSGEGCALRRIR